MIQMRAQVQDGHWRLDVQGHAQYNPGGPDILCAAASVLCCALAQALEDAQAPGLAVLQAPGRFALRVRPSAPAHWGMIETAQAGLELLAKQYPKYIAWR